MKTGTKNRSIEFWRFVFTLFVVLGHIQATFMGETVFTTGGNAVEFFFMLSGFLLYASFERSAGTRRGALFPALRMTWKKIRHFLPMCWLCIAASAAFMAWMNRGNPEYLSQYLNSVWPELFLVNGFITAPSGITINGATWYISILIAVSFCLYLALGLCRGSKRAELAVSGLGAVFFMIWFYARPWPVLPHTESFVRGLSGMCLGLVAYRLSAWLQTGGFAPGRAVSALVQALAVAGFIAVLFVRPPDDKTRLLVLPCFFLLIVTNFGTQTRLNALLDNPVSAFLGKISLWIYLSHSFWLTKFGWMPLFDLNANKVISYLIILFTIIAVSAVLACVPDVLRQIRSAPVEEAPGRMRWADALRAFAIVCVAFIHVSGGSFWAVAPGRTFGYLTLYDTLAHLAVPIFLMISGMLLLSPNKRITAADIARRYLSRVALAFAGWSAFYAVYNAVLNETLFSGGWRALLADFLQGRYHLWYLFLLAGIYCATPFLRLITCAQDKRLTGLFVLLCVLFSVVTPFLGGFVPSVSGVLARIDPALFPLYPGYFVAGYYLSTVRLTERWRRRLLVITPAAAALSVAWVYLESRAAGTLVETGWSASSPVMMAYIAGVFLLFREYGDRLFARKRLAQWITALSSGSFVIYLSHDLFLSLFAKLGVTAITGSPLLMVPLLSAAVLLCSLCVVYVPRTLFAGFVLPKLCWRDAADRLRASQPVRTAAVMAALLIWMRAAAACQTRWPQFSRLFANLFFLGLWGMLLFVAYLCVRRTVREIGFTRRQWAGWLFASGIVAAAAGGFVFLFLAQENTIKTWDSAGYWSKFVQNVDLFYNDIPSALQNLIGTLSGEYSDLAVLPLLPLGVYLGRWFPRYAFFVFACYAAPVCLLFSLYVLRLLRRSGRVEPKLWHGVACTAVCAFCVPLLHPVILGYVDIAGLVLVLLHLHVVFDRDMTRFDWKQCAMLALLSLTLLLTRRWYAFWIIGFYFSFGVLLCKDCIAARRIDWKKAGGLAANLALIAGACLAWLWAVTPGTLTMFFGSNYSQAYSAYKFRTDLGDLLYLCQDFGWLFVALAAAGLVWLVRRRAIRDTILLWICTFAVSFVLFQRVQSAGVHHRYLFIPLLILGMCAAVCGFPAAFRRGWMRRAFAALCAACCAVNFLAAYVAPESGPGALRGTVLTQVTEKPDVRTDVEQIRQVVRDINTLTGEELQKAYVVGDGNALSQELLKRALMPELTDATPNVISGSIIDLRDGFPSSAFLANYVLVADPLQGSYGTGKDVIALLYDLFMNGSAWEEYYSVVSTEETPDSTLLLFRKEKTITKEFVDLLRETLREKYPDAPFVYEPDYFWALLNIRASAPWQYASWGPVVLLEQADGTSCFWETGGHFSVLELELTNWSGDMTITVTADGEIVEERLLDASGQQTVTIEIGNAQTVEVSFAGEESASLQLAGSLRE